MRLLKKEIGHAFPDKSVAAQTHTPTSLAHNRHETWWGKRDVRGRDVLEQFK
jgi:hypothetical protein